MVIEESSLVFDLRVPAGESGSEDWRLSPPEGHPEHVFELQLSIDQSAITTFQVNLRAVTAPSKCGFGDTWTR